MHGFVTRFVVVGLTALLLFNISGCHEESHQNKNRQYHLEYLGTMADRGTVITKIRFSFATSTAVFAAKRKSDRIRQALDLLVITYNTADLDDGGRRMKLMLKGVTEGLLPSHPVEAIDLLDYEVHPYHP